MMTLLHPLMAISPVDGRYKKTTAPLQFMGEFGLHRSRLLMMTEYLIVLSNEPGLLPDVAGTTPEEQKIIRDIADISLEDAEIISAIEKKGYMSIKATNHDVQACVLFLKMRLRNAGLGHLEAFVHLFSTSEDPNNIAYATMLSKARDVLLEVIEVAVNHLSSMAERYAELPMRAETHGQPASPTTLGKELNVFCARQRKHIQKLRAFRVSAKCNGATGNYDAHMVVAPKVDWFLFSDKVIDAAAKAAGIKGDLEVNLVTTQIEDHDSYVELFQIFMRINSVFVDLDKDMWDYISDDWIVLKPVEGEVGSSAMPHKVNPIDFENSWGNLRFANAILAFFVEALPRSRRQRDLSDSTVCRNFGVALSHCLIGYTALLKGLGKVSADEEAIRAALNARPEVISEAYQVMLRIAGYGDAYNTMKDFTRGKKMTLELMHDFVRSLDVPDELKERMLAVTPENYIGLAPEIAVL